MGDGANALVLDTPAELSGATGSRQPMCTSGRGAKLRIRLQHPPHAGAVVIGGRICSPQVEPGKPLKCNGFAGRANRVSAPNKLLSRGSAGERENP